MKCGRCGEKSTTLMEATTVEGSGAYCLKCDAFIFPSVPSPTLTNLDLDQELEDHELERQQAADDRARTKS